MSSNQKIILDTIINQQKVDLESDLSNDEFFEFFVTSQILKDYELSYDEIDEGIVDNGGDGGIDSIYLFVNGDHIRPDSPIVQVKRNASIELHVIQSKNTNGFNETAIQKLTSSASRLFDLSLSIDELRQKYNNELLKIISKFRDQYLAAASKFPTLRFVYYYASKGNQVHPNTSAEVINLELGLKKFFDKIDFDFNFVTAQDLIEFSRKEQIRSKSLRLADNPISTNDGGYIALAPIVNYYDFITEEDGTLIKYFFDANIRDYQGKVEVNRAIKDTLLTKSNSEDFWWLNNGITITVSKAVFSSKQLLIEDPQIVNGLQTSFEIYKYFSQNRIEGEERNVLIRIISPESEASRLKIIKSTNSQTNIPSYSLRATDPIHKNIEDYLLSNQYYYDRRKNYHKNQGRPIKRIVSISYLAQIVMSILHQKPDYARARPSTLIKKDAEYNSIFNENVPIQLYLNCIKIQHQVKKELKEFENPKLSRAQIGDLRFYVSMFSTATYLKKAKPNINDLKIINLAEEEFKPFIIRAINDVFAIYELMGGNDGVAKGAEFVDEVKQQIIEVIEEEE